jgi:NitT/TauT family transport system substrate-binding protein
VLRVIPAVLTLGLAVLCAQCADPVRPLRLGLIVWPAYELPVLARSLGRLDPARVDIVDYGSPAEALRAYRNGVIDAVALTTTYVIELLSDAQIDRIVLVIDVSKGGDAVVASPSIHAVHQLRGRRIGVESGSLGGFVLARALQNGGLSPRDVELVSIDVPGQEAAFRSGTIDAVVTYEPFRSRLLADGARDVFNSAMMPNEIVDVLVVREAAIARHDRALRHLADAWFDGLEYLQDHKEDAAARVAARERVTPDGFLLSLRGTELLDREANRRWLSGEHALIHQHLRTLADAMRSTGLSGESVNLTRVSTDRFIQ